MEYLNGLPACVGGDTAHESPHRNAGFIRQNHQPHPALPDESGVPFPRGFMARAALKKILRATNSGFFMTLFFQR
jgi:hypothetical protein